MEENLVGYLLQSLDPETHRQVDLYLKQSPEGRNQLEWLRQALEPLSADTGELSPRPGLWIRTLAHIAQDRCRETKTNPERSTYSNLPAAPRSPWSEGTQGRPTWRWVDVVALAAMFCIVASLGLVGLTRVWRDEIQLACQNNLRILHSALVAYSERHRGNFPKVETDPPENVAGIFVPMLRDEGVLASNVNLSCSGKPPSPTQVHSMDELRRMEPKLFASLAHQLGGCYAYCLGYGEPGNLVGLRLDDDQRLPILADRPLIVKGQVSNSPNHGGRGQNVLFVDGHVQFFSGTNVGVDRDDIFLNKQGRVAAGWNRFDSVLGASAAHPFPAE